MNLNLERYRVGACYITAHVYPRRGKRRVAVLDPHIRVRAAIRALTGAGLTPIQIARQLHLPTVLVETLAPRADTFFRMMPKGADL